MRKKDFAVQYYNCLNFDPQIVKNPVENGIEMVLDNVQQLRTVINRIRSDPSQSTNPLTMKLNGTLDAAVNGGVSKFDVCLCVSLLQIIA